MARVHLASLGCRVNEAELEQWARDFRAHGVTLAATPEQADLLVVNTCAVTTEAARKSRQLLRRSHRRNPGARLIVSGCYATLDSAGVAGLPGIDLLVPNTDKDRLVEQALAQLDSPTMPAEAMESDAEVLFRRGRQRAFVKVQDGCRWRCSFCIVTIARGQERSRTIAELIAEVNSVAAAGVSEIVLTGVHIGGYGSERGDSLADLLRALLVHTDIPRIRIGSLEPWDLPPDLLGLLASPRLLPHLHLPLQSGCDATLKRMARRCRTADFAALLAQARAAAPMLNVTTDVIVGFPGETDAHWAESLAFVEAMGFGDLHVFSYSPRPGTAAARMPDQVPEATRRERSRAMLAAGARMRRAFMASMAGTPVAVLWESVVGEDDAARRVGYTPNYVRVEQPLARGAAVNTISRVTPLAVNAAGTALEA